MAAVFHRQTEPYSSHEAGDSIYDHSGEKVKTSVLGFAIALTLGFSAIELVAGWLGNSLALVGDAGHMVTDSMSLLFALVANIFSRHGADEDHSFGHGRLEALAAFVNGIVMSGVIVWIVIEAGKRMMNPEPVSGGSVMMVATIGLIVNVGVAWSLSRDKKNVNTRAALVHVMGDLLGSVSAILAGFIVWMGGPTIVDPLLSIIVACLLIRATIGIFKESTRVLLDAVPEGVEYEAVGDAIAAVPGVMRVHDLHVWTMAPGHSAIQAHVHIPAPDHWPTVLDAIRHQMAEKFGIDHVSIQPEWDACEIHPDPRIRFDR